MLRDYQTGASNDISIFTGIEIEKTPAYGKKTLFIVGIKPVSDIENFYIQEDCKHIFFGANHSFNPVGYDEHKQWENMICYFLKKEILCSLDIPMSQVEEFHESGYCEYDNFIPQIRVPIPYIKLWNYNTMLKIDDKDFKATNPGVWCHSLYDLKDRSKFTPWVDYSNDKVIK
jgi:hypothetical protein